MTTGSVADAIYLQLISVRWWNASAYYGVSLSDALQKSGYKAITAGRADSPPLQKAREWQLPTFEAINLESLSPVFAIRNLRSLTGFIRSNNVRLINAHRPEDMAFAGLLKMRFGKMLPVVRTVSDVRPPKDHLLNKMLHQTIDFFIFTCKASYDRYQSVWPVFAERSAIIYSAIDTDVFTPLSTYSDLRRRLGFVESDIVIGIIARLDPVKDHHTFLQAAKQVADAAAQARFLIAGEECEVSQASLEVLASDLGIRDRVVFVPRDDAITARELIGCLDIGVVASKGSEVICRIAVEYMAMAVPQVVTDTNVLPEIVSDGDNGFVVPAGNAAEMATAMLRLVNSPELRRKTGENGRRAAVDRFSYPALVRQTVDVYQRLSR